MFWADIINEFISTKDRSPLAHNNIDICIRIEYNNDVRKKNQLRTVRFSEDEAAQLEVYLAQNPVFESFSSLARVATLTLIQQKCAVQLNPVTISSDIKRPPFLWDYELDEVQVREILSRSNTDPKKIWLTERILREARFDEVFRYLTLKEIQRVYPKIRADQKLKRRWEYALQRWAKHEKQSEG
ncbi:MAG: hypothetical protein ACD_62C00088G0004 [uncultured bacterium]|nr:MAG: hypothetical protein ACD_62C00088G0004 [uncultured bacterium]